MKRFRGSWATLALWGFAALAGACTQPTVESASSLTLPIVKGEASDSSQDAVVLLVHYDAKTHEFGSCTGTLLSPRIVLTARHCVSSTDEGMACGADGSALAGGAVYRDHAADTMFVFVGAERPQFGRGEVKASGRGEKVFHNGAKNLCNSDIAVIALAEPVESAPIAPVALDRQPEPGELFTAVGWGVTERTDTPRVRQQRAGIKIERVGPHSGLREALGPSEFGVGESICSGDSGGPALDETGAVIGVVSRGGRDDLTGEAESAADQCIDGTNVYTEVAPFKDLVLEAFEYTGEEVWEAGGPDPRLLKFGEACSAAEECRSNLCLEGSCSVDCTESACPEGSRCEAVGEVNACLVRAEPAPAPRAAESTREVTSTGCASAPGGARVPYAGLVLLGLVAGAFRRRRAR